MDRDDPTHELLRAWQQAGDGGALQELLARNLEWIRERVRLRLGGQLRSREESMDLVQEVALDVLRSGPRFVVGDQDQFRGLLARIVENTIRDRARWHGAARRAAARERDLGGASIDLSASRPGPATELAGRERAELLRLAVELLGEHDRDVVRLHQLEGRPMSEVAELLGLHASTAHMRYRRALPRLALVFVFCPALSGSVPLRAACCQLHFINIILHFIVVSFHFTDVSLNVRILRSLCGEGFGRPSTAITFRLIAPVSL